MAVATRKLKARKTEYKGIVYRSKCEAMFARYLELWIEEMRSYCNELIEKGEEDLRLYAFCGFEYEPQYFSVDGWTPDFVVYQLNPRGISDYPDLRDDVPKLVAHIIEYKPSVPTSEYIREWLAKCDYLFYLQRDRYPDLRFFYEIYFGSVFSDFRGIIKAERGGAEFTDTLDGRDWLKGFEDEIRSTRFDLNAPR